MTNQVYTILFMNMDMAVLDFKVFGSFKAALKVYLQQAIKESKERVEEEEETENEEDLDSEEDDDEDYDEDDEDEVTCIFQIFELPKKEGAVEYELKSEYDIDSFIEFLSEKTDADAYVEQLEKDLSVDSPTGGIPEDILAAFTN